MHEPKRMKKILKTLDEFKNDIDYFYANTSRLDEKIKQIEEVKSNIIYLSTEKKIHRVRLAKKILKSHIQQISNNFLYRLYYAVRYIIFYKEDHQKTVDKDKKVC